MMKAIFSHINDIVDQDFFVEHILIVDLNDTRSFTFYHDFTYSKIA